MIGAEIEPSCGSTASDNPGGKQDKQRVKSMESICRDRMAAARLMKEYGLVSEGAKRMFALSRCSTASDCAHRSSCHIMLEHVWQAEECTVTHSPKQVS